MTDPRLFAATSATTAMSLMRRHTQSSGTEMHNHFLPVRRKIALATSRHSSLFCACIADSQPVCDICGGTLDAPLPATLPTGYPCLICGEYMDNALGLIAHSVKHTGINPFFCTLCPRNFTCHESLHNHLEVFHPAPSLVGPKRKRRDHRQVPDERGSPGQAQ